MEKRHFSYVLYLLISIFIFYGNTAFSAQQRVVFVGKLDAFGTTFWNLIDDRDEILSFERHNEKIALPISKVCNKDTKCKVDCLVDENGTILKVFSAVPVQNEIKNQ